MQCLEKTLPHHLQLPRAVAVARKGQSPSQPLLLVEALPLPVDSVVNPLVILRQPKEMYRIAFRSSNCRSSRIRSPRFSCSPRCSPPSTIFAVGQWGHPTRQFCGHVERGHPIDQLSQSCNAVHQLPRSPIRLKLCTATTNM